MLVPAGGLNNWVAGAPPPTQFRTLPGVVNETGKNRGRLCGQRLVIGGVGGVRVPASIVVGEGVVEDSVSLRTRVRICSRRWAPLGGSSASAAF